jgi:hypothetical protein
MVSYRNSGHFVTENPIFIVIITTAAIIITYLHLHLPDHHQNYYHFHSDQALLILASG